jgi:hypothetical protein
MYPNSIADCRLRISDWGILSLKIQNAEFGIKTVEHSLGILGQMKRLPAEEILQLTTMCGHGMVPVNLVEKTVAEIKRGKKNYREAALELTRPCHCGIYNPVRAERLLRRLVPLMVLED